MKKLFLLDAYALIYRAYYALIRSPRMTSKGLNTSAIFGFCNTLDDVIRKEHPTHLAVCFDPHGPTFRHEVYPEYKAQRDKQPEDITLAIPYIKEILAAMRIPVVEVAGYEADDIIGTLSRRAEAEGFETYMMTPDKDYAQLVTDRVFMYRPALRGEGFEVRGPARVCERYGVPDPRRVIDLLALEGDASDNVPGCPGVGEKTARTLIETWGTVENLIENVDKLKGALQKKVATNSEQILFSKFLVTIKTDVPLPPEITLESFAVEPPDLTRLREIYRALEFRSFLKKLDEEAPTPTPEPAHPAATADNGGMGSLFDDDGNPSAEAASVFECPTGSYGFALTPDEINSAVSRALEAGQAGVAVCAIGEEAMTARLQGVAIAPAECSAVYVPLGATDAERDARIEALRPLFEGRATLVSHDVKRDMIILRRNGLRWRAPYFDTGVAHYLIDSESKHTLPIVMESYLRLESPLFPADARKWYPAGRISPEDARDRYTVEADVVLRLRPLLTKTVADEQMTCLLHDIEFPLIRVLAAMEWTGMRIDPAELHTLSGRLSAQLSELETEAYRLAGHPFNIGSPSQVGEVLFGELKLDPKAKKTARGGYSTTEAVLEKHRSHPLVDLILKIRKLRKLLATYVDSLPSLINPATGKIHTTLNQTITATGRISSTNPNLQNIPVRSDDGREIRRAFIADPGCLFMSADYSQIELRLIADLSGDESMIEAFIEGDDIHRATAAKINHLPLSEVTDDQRRRAKTANFGIIYGISAFGLSERLGIPRSEAKELIEGYFAGYPGIRRYLDKAVEDARAKGYVTTVMGRRRRLPDINSRNAVVRGYAERNAVNAPLQGSAADIIKIAMIRIFDEMSRLDMRSRMIMQVHDELLFNVVPDELSKLQELVTRNMEQAWVDRVPLEVSAGVASNWLEAH